MQMDPKMVVLLVIVVIAIVVIALILMQKRKAALRQRFGSEYDRAVREGGSERKAQSLLQEREKRVEKFHIRPLNAAERQQFAEHWHGVQSRFVDDPRGAVTEADEGV